MNLKDYHPILDLSNYLNSKYLIDELDQNNFKVLYFCQNKDQYKVNNNINLLSKQFNNLSFLKSIIHLDDWEQLLLMSLCNHNILL